MSYTGVQAIKIYLDGKPLTNLIDKNDVYILRRAPGNQNYNYVQMINFCESEKQLCYPGPQETIDLSRYVVGFVFQFVIYSSWGDKYYCGLNGVKLLDENKLEISLETQSMLLYK